MLIEQITLVGTMDDIIKILRKAMEAGYADLPAVWSLKLFLERN